MIRSNFLDVLHAAVTGGEPVGLDFVYGEVEDGTLRAARRPATAHHAVPPALVPRSRARIGSTQRARLDAVHLRDPAERPRFLRAARERARCLPTTSHALRAGSATSPGTCTLAARPDDPVDARDASTRSTSGSPTTTSTPRGSGSPTPSTPAISFHLLPIDDMGSARGPLHQDELAREAAHRVRELQGPLREDLERLRRGPREFADKVDGAWSDLLWPLHGGDDIVDDEFLSYIEFVIELCEWRD